MLRVDISNQQVRTLLNDKSIVSEAFLYIKKLQNSSTRGRDEASPNPHNPYSNLTPEEREKGLIAIAAQILSTHSLKELEKNEKAISRENHSKI